MAFLEVRDMRKNFGGTEVLKGVSFSLEKGKVLAVIGSSGNGKTTLLRCLNGLEEADGGSVTVDGVTLNYGATTEENAVNGGKKPKKKKRAAEKGAENRDFTLVFQNFQLFPQYTAKRNVSLAADLSELRALKNEKLPRKEKSALKKQIREKNDENARRLLEKVGLAEKCAAYPCELSGGQQQRVSIARALRRADFRAGPAPDGRNFGADQRAESGGAHDDCGNARNGVCTERGGRNFIFARGQSGGKRQRGGSVRRSEKRAFQGIYRRRKK